MYKAHEEAGWDHTVAIQVAIMSSVGVKVSYDELHPYRDSKASGVVIEGQAAWDQMATIFPAPESV